MSFSLNTNTNTFRKQRAFRNVFVFVFVFSDNVKHPVKRLVFLILNLCQKITWYRGANKFLARPTSRSISFDGENISFDASLVIYIKSTNIPPIMIINRICETQNLLSL